MQRIKSGALPFLRQFLPLKLIAEGTAYLGFFANLGPLFRVSRVIEDR